MKFKEFSGIRESFVPYNQRQLGSTPGGMFIKQQSGEKYYVKFPHNPEQAHVEAATADLYTAMGIKTLSPEVVSVDGQGVGLASKWNSGAKSLTDPSQYHTLMMHPKHSDMLARMHHAAIITGNRDIVGADYNNVMYDKYSDELVSADQGGSMHFRAMGATKPFMHDTDDVHAFQDQQYPAGKVFSQLPHESLRSGATHIDKLTNHVVDAIMDKWGLSKETGDVIKQRRDMLKQHYST